MVYYINVKKYHIHFPMENAKVEGHIETFLPICKDVKTTRIHAQTSNPIIKRDVTCLIEKLKEITKYLMEKEM